jgi:periplasmic protein TonB
MLGSKFNVYGNEWLDLVFENRNQTYGAYELRKNYDRTMVKALLVASFLFVSAVSGPFIYQQVRTADPLNTADVLADDPDERIVRISLPPKQREAPKPETLPAPAAAKTPAAPQHTVKYTDMRAVPANQATDEPPSMVDVQHAAVGLENISGTEVTGNGETVSNTGTQGTGIGTGEGNPDGNELVNTALLEKLPEFPGGLEAFAKFLRKNLRYPSAAAESGLQGRVMVSFVVEKDGTLTDLTVLRGLGMGCSEEALRVLKKSPAWSPGIQNHRKVRVMYTLPVVFSLGD